MKRILVVFTGGTIGCRIQNAIIDVDENAGYYLIEAFQNQNKYNVEFDTIQPMNILSENATPVHWQKLYASLKQIDLNQYSGIIVTHGSDTLPYTSAALSFLLQYTTIPVVLTASNYALGCPGSNGIENFCSSVEFILNSPIPGVFTVFQNDKRENIVYLASRIMEADSYNDQFSSFGGGYFGELKNGSLVFNKSKINPTLPELLKPREKLLEDIDFTEQILAIRAYPGLDFSFYAFKKKPKAVLLSLYHSGTGCTGVSDYSVTEFVKHCRNEKIDSYLISFKRVKCDLYQTSRDILENGAHPLQNISFEAAYAKLCIAYNQTVIAPLEYIEKNLFFEYLGNK
jgi:L-asparaginase